MLLTHEYLIQLMLLIMSTSSSHAVDHEYLIELMLLSMST